MWLDCVPRHHDASCVRKFFMCILCMLCMLSVNLCDMLCWCYVLTAFHAWLTVVLCCNCDVAKAPEDGQRTLHELSGVIISKVLPPPPRVQVPPPQLKQLSFAEA
jgi:hypothetical protein